MREHRYYVYILTNPSKHPLYTGVTNNIERRVGQHRSSDNDSYTARYHLTRLVHLERYRYVMSAIRREKEVKQWGRAKKIALIETTNPKWDDLARGWGEPMELMIPKT